MKTGTFVLVQVKKQWRIIIIHYTDSFYLLFGGINNIFQFVFLLIFFLKPERICKLLLLLFYGCLQKDIIIVTDNMVQTFAVKEKDYLLHQVSVYQKDLKTSEDQRSSSRVSTAGAGKVDCLHCHSVSSPEKSHKDTWALSKGWWWHNRASAAPRNSNYVPASSPDEPEVHSPRTHP